MKKQIESPVKNTNTQRDIEKINKDALVALQASIRVNTASEDTQDITIADNAAIGTENTDNAAIDAENTDNAAIDAENTEIII